MGLDNVNGYRQTNKPEFNINTNSLVGFIIGILIGMLLMYLISISGSDKPIVQLPDTTFNKVKLDSIKVQIGKHDTTIYKLNIKLKDDVEKSYALSDSATVELFKQLSQGSGTIE